MDTPLRPLAWRAAASHCSACTTGERAQASVAIGCAWLEGLHGARHSAAAAGAPPLTAHHPTCAQNAAVGGLSRRAGSRRLPHLRLARPGLCCGPGRGQVRRQAGQREATAVLAWPSTAAAAAPGSLPTHPLPPPPRTPTCDCRSVLMLETVNYVEHYGLQRQRLPDGRCVAGALACLWVPPAAGLGQQGGSPGPPPPPSVRVFPSGKLSALPLIWTAPTQRLRILAPLPPARPQVRALRAAALLEHEFHVHQRRHLQVRDLDLSAKLEGHREAAGAAGHGLVGLQSESWLQRGGWRGRARARCVRMLADRRVYVCSHACPLNRALPPSP